jgi:cytochrome c oxidase subunit II
VNPRLLWTLLFLTVPIFGVGLFVMSAYSYGGWLPDNISEHGVEIDSLFYIILAITGITFVLTEGLLVWAMWTGRGPNNGKAAYTHGNHRLEVAWTLVTVAILLYVALAQIPVWSRVKYYGNRPKKTPDILVTASQFHWTLRYPAWNEGFKDETGKAKPQPHTLNTFNPTLSQTFALSNELHIFADKDEPVLVHLQTLDVQHAFWLPAARVKQDAVPGHLIPIWFKIDPEMLAKTGNPSNPDHTKKRTLTVGTEKFEVYEFEWTCAELCGWGHAMMRARLYVHPTRQQYNSWLKAASAQRFAEIPVQATK